MKKLRSFVVAAFLSVISILLLTTNALAATGDYVNTDHLSGQFNVPAIQEAGVDFTNKTGQTVTITVNTEGTWDVSSTLKNLDADGAPSAYLPYLTDQLKYLKYPDKKPFSLLAVNKSSNPPEVTQVGKQSQFKLAPGATISFLNNEIDPKYVPDVYNDNAGNIAIKWSANPLSTATAQTNTLSGKISLQSDTGKWLTRCNNCQRVIGTNPDTATVHIDQPSASTPYAQFEVVNVGNGKIALKADTGKYLARCRSCIQGGAYPDFATFHVTDSSLPYAQFTPELLSNGKYALKADTGKYLARCNSCSPGAAYPDTVTIHVDSPEGKSYAQWNITRIP